MVFLVKILREDFALIVVVLILSIEIIEYEIAISSGSLDSKVPVKGHIFYKDKKSNLTFPSYKEIFSISSRFF